MSKIVSFFSGAGFLDLGLESVGFETLMANEINPDFAFSYVYGRSVAGLPAPKYGVSCTSVEEFLSGPYSKVLSRICANERRNGEVVGFVGGPPCPDFSIAGKNVGHTGDNGRLTECYVDLICQHKPDWFLLENVKGLWRTKKHREFFDRMIQKLWDSGYQTNAELLNSIQFNVPQDRDRVFIFGIRNMHLGQRRGGELANFNFNSHATYLAREAFDFAWPSAGEPINYDTPEELTVMHWFERNDVENHPNQSCRFTPRAGLARFQITEEGDVSKKSYKRLHRGRYSPTACYGNNEVHLHPTEDRRISVAEALSLQSMPLEFALPPEITLSAMFKMVGNGVPYLLARGVALTINDYLQEVLTNER